MSKHKWISWGLTGVICLAIIGVTGVIVAGIMGAELEPALALDGLDKTQQGRIAAAVDKILAMNVPTGGLEGAYSGAEIRDGTYEEAEIEGVHQAIFVLDLPHIKQSYKINYYYVTEEQESHFKYTALASCLPTDQLRYGDFDCRGDLQTVFIDQWHEIASKLAVEYGIPWEAVMAQGVLESASGTSEYAVERNNFFGIGAFDSNPDNAFWYPSPEEGWRGYFENIVHVDTQVYCRAGVFTGDNITNPYSYLATVKKAGYATDPDYVKLTSELVKVIEERSAKKGWEGSADLAVRYPEMLTNAAKKYAIACR